MVASSQQNPKSRERPERIERGIRRLPNGTYEVRVFVSRDPLTGKTRSVSRTVKGGIKAARAKRSQLEVEISQGKHGGTVATLGFLLDAWNAQREKEGKSPTTLHEDRRKIDAAIRPALGGVRLDRLTTRDIDQFYADQLAGGTSPATVRKYHAILHAALETGCRWSWLPTNPAHRASRPKPVVRQPVAPTSATVLELIREAEKGRSPHMAGIIMFGALSGLRAGELCALRFSNVDWEGEVVVTGSVWQIGKRHGVKDTKSHLARRVAIDDAALEVLRWRRAACDAAWAASGGQRPPDAFVWSRDELGVSYLLPKSVTAGFVRVRERLGVKVRLHDLRHYAGTEMIAAGVDPRTVKDQLGHADVATSLRLYVTSRDEGRRGAAAALGASLLRRDGAEPTQK